MPGRKLTTPLVGVLAVVALAVLGWLGTRAAPSLDGPTEARALALGVEADTLAASSDPGDPALLDGASDVDRARTSRDTSQPEHDDTRATPSADDAGGLTVFVTSKATGAPLPRTQLWALGEGLGLEWADQRGRVTFPGLSGTIKLGVRRTGALTEDTFVVVGGDDEPRDSVELHVPPGTRHTVTIALTEGASIVGRVFDAEGTALPQFRFFRFGADGDQWIEARPVETDDAGSFEVVGLAPGWYLLGPDPAKDDVFACARMELARSERREVALQLLPAQHIQVTVSARGIVRGEPWRLPVRACLYRADSLQDLLATSLGTTRGHAWENGMAPLTLERPLRAGPHVLRLASTSGAWTSRPSAVAGAAARYTYCIAPAWEVALPFEVADGTREIELEALVADTGEVAVLELTVVYADEHAAATRRNFPNVSMGWRDRSGEARASGLLGGIGRTTLTVLVDLDEVQGRALEIQSRVGSHDPQLVTAITLRPGTQRATADVSSH
jgi:hypothetical protein